MTSALILWKRHNVEIVTAPTFDEDEAAAVLGSIPKDLESNTLLPWLQLVLPSLLQLDAERIPLVVEWIIRKAASFESSERHDWPLNALKFTEDLLRSLNSVSSQADGPLYPLCDSIGVFKELVTLYENYKMPITYIKFTQVQQFI